MTSECRRTGVAGKIMGQGSLLFAGFALVQLLSFARNAVLGHWLSKGDFGIAATITLVLQTVEIMSDLGADRLLLQSGASADRRLMANLHATLLARGAVTSAILALLAWPVAMFFRVEDAWPAFAAIAVVPLAKCLVHLDYRRRKRDLDNTAYMVVEVIPQVFAFAALVPALWVLGDYRAVVVVSVLQAAAMAMASRLIARGPFEIGFDRATLKRIAAFGWPIWLSAFPLVAVFHGDRALVGRMLGIEVLAGYSAVFMLTMVPGLLAAKVGNAIMLPLLSRARSQQLQFATSFRLMVELTVVLAALYAAGFILCGETLLPLAFGPNYRGLGEVGAWLAVMWAVRMVQAVPGMALMAHEHTRPFLIAGLVRASGLALSAAAILCGAHLEGVAAAGLLAELASLMTMCWLLDRVVADLGRSCLWRSLALIPVLALTIAFAWASSRLGGNIAVDMARLACLAPAIVLVLGLTLPELRRISAETWRRRLATSAVAQGLG